MGTRMTLSWSPFYNRTYNSVTKLLDAASTGDMNRAVWGNRISVNFMKSGRHLFKDQMRRSVPVGSDTVDRPEIETPENTPIVVSMKGIVKRFPGVLANDHVDFELRQGEIHALLGENGAGKSTLMNVLAGLYKQDAGTLTVKGKPAVFSSPRDAINA